MGVIEGTTDYYLKRPFQYSINGKMLDATYITLREPTSDHRHGYWVMKQHIAKAMQSILKMTRELGLDDDNEQEQSLVGSKVRNLSESVDEVEKVSNDIDHDKGIELLLLSGDIDISNFMNTFYKMVCLKAKKNLALVDGDDKVPLNSNLLDKMHPDDQLSLAVRWCAFFIMSEMSQEQTISEGSLESHSQVKVV